MILPLYKYILYTDVVQIDSRRVDINGMGRTSELIDPTAFPFKRQGKDPYYKVSSTVLPSRNPNQCVYFLNPESMYTTKHSIMVIQVSTHWS